jgi:hypothetical protein
MICWVGGHFLDWVGECDPIVRKVLIERKRRKKGKKNARHRSMKYSFQAFQTPFFPHVSFVPE